ncbi:MAG: LLM class flavin-dependent oxidoreductase [Deltaproteobacteria bacterium]|nr:LLM class flavin-dependent oxidoreductase [Deltaproteobacteria bacterium]
MRLGALLGFLPPQSPVGDLTEQARRFAGEGFDSLWVPQAIGRGFMIPDPFVALTAIAMVTKEIELGTAVAQISLYQPTDLSHRIFSLMHICGKRLTFGVGAGSTETDFIALERDYGKRFKTFNSTLARVRTLLAEGKDERANLTPWTATAGGPPLVFGSWGAGVERAAKEFDGWIASAHYRTPEQVIASLGRYRAAGGKRAIVSTIQLTPEHDVGRTNELLQRFAEAGFDDAVVLIRPGGPSPADVRALVK